VATPERGRRSERPTSNGERERERERDRERDLQYGSADQLPQALVQHEADLQRGRVAEDEGRAGNTREQKGGGREREREKRLKREREERERER
jgi:hypothetical protein